MAELISLYTCWNSFHIKVRCPRYLFKLLNFKFTSLTKKIRGRHSSRPIKAPPMIENTNLSFPEIGKCVFDGGESVRGAIGITFSITNKEINCFRGNLSFNCLEILWIFRRGEDFAGVGVWNAGNGAVVTAGGVSECTESEIWWWVFRKCVGWWVFCGGGEWWEEWVVEYDGVHGGGAVVVTVVTKGPPLVVDVICNVVFFV